MRPIFLAMSLCLLAAAGAAAQSFPTPNYFRQLFVPPAMRSTAPGPKALRQYVLNGKLQLTVDDAVKLALLNNTNVRIDRLTIDQARYNLENAYAPFDPSLTNSFTSSRSVTPATNTLQGAETLDSYFQNYQSTYSQTLGTGTNYSVGYNATKGTINSFFYFLNPYLTSGLTVQVKQPLLRNRGLFANRAPILIARRNLQESRATFEASVSTLLQAVINDYWAVVQARESLQVARSSLAQAQASYEHDEKSLKLGALPQIDIYRPEGQVAQRRLAVIQQEYALKRAQEQFRQDIGADLDPSTEALPLDLVENPQASSSLATVVLKSALQQAFQNRPELQALRQKLEADRLSIRYQHNQMLPDLELSGNYASNGVGGPQIVSNPGQPVVVIPGGFGGALGQMFRFRYPAYGLGITFTLPIRNHAAEAALGQAAVSRENDLYAVRLEKQNIRLEVTNSVRELEESKEALATATEARNLAQKTLQAEQLKYRLGTEQIYFVLEAQTELAQAEESLVEAEIGYRVALTAVNHSTGDLLSHFNVQLAP